MATIKKVKKAQSGIIEKIFGSKEDRISRRGDRQFNREKRRAERRGGRGCRRGTCFTGNMVGFKDGGSVTKAQDGKKLKGTAPAMAGLNSKKAAMRKKEEAKSSYQSSTSPKVEYTARNKQSVSVDTSGMAAGKKRFPAKVTSKSGKESYYPINKSSAKRAVKYSQKNGGKTSKKK